MMVYYTTTPIEPHAVHSERLMRCAWDGLASDDLDQASESGWNAFVHAVKAVAGERGWEYPDINLVRPVISALAEENSDPELQSELNSATMLYINYRCDDMDGDEIELDLQTVERGLERLQDISRRYREDAEYRARADALLPPYRTYNPRRRRWEELAPNGDGLPDSPDE